VSYSALSESFTNDSMSQW